LKIERSFKALKNITRRPLKVFSDIDDTLLCSGGSFGNTDQRYPQGVLYPGVTTFYKELDLGPDDENSPTGLWPKNRFGNLVYVSARPHISGTIYPEMLSYQSFKTYFDSNKLYCFPTLLSGNMKGVIGAVKKDFQAMAEKKI